MRKPWISLGALACALTLSLPVQAKDTLKADLPLSSTGAVEIDIINGSLEIQGHSGGGVHMVAIVKGGKNTFLYRTDGEVAVFKQDPPKHRLHWKGKVDLTLKVPEGVDVRVDGVNMDVGAHGLTGNIRVNLVNGGLALKPGCDHVRAETVNGEIFIAGVSHGAHLESVNGRIALQNVSGEVRAKTVNGAIRVEGGVISNAHLNTLNGDIDWASIPSEQATIVCDTHGGSITVLIPDDLDSAVHAETFSGRISTAFRSLRKHRRSKEIDFSIGSGLRPVEFRLSTFNGSIDVDRMK